MELDISLPPHGSGKLALLALAGLGIFSAINSSKRQWPSPQKLAFAEAEVHQHDCLEPVRTTICRILPMLCQRWRRKGVVIADPSTFARKRATFVKAGPLKLQIITDFDRTLSVCFKVRAGWTLARFCRFAKRCRSRLKTDSAIRRARQDISRSH